MFYKSAVIVCDAATIMIRHIADASFEKAGASKDPKRKAN
jgi:hypothetical protein